MRHHIYVFLVLTIIILIIACISIVYPPWFAKAQADEPLQTPAEAMPMGSGSSSSENTAAESEFFGIDVTINYPPFSDGSLQTALKPGDSFSVSVASRDLLLHDVLVDAGALGFSSEQTLSGSFGHFTSEAIIVPQGTPDGTYAMTVRAHSALGTELSAIIAVSIDSLPPTGSLEASLGTTTDIPARLVAHLAGSYSGTGSETIIVGGTVFSANAEGIVLERKEIDTHSVATLPSPFTTSLTLPSLDSSWIRIGISLTLLDEAGNTAVITSALFPRTNSNDVLINHAQGGSVVTAPNYVPGDIPYGVGIPHTLLNALPDGDYYAVVFFDGSIGCPTSNYEINAFRAGAYWGYGVVGSSGLYSHAWSSHAGGCMQQFHINPDRGDDWLWGALSNTGMANAISDASGIPAFAICATEAACDAITISSDITPTPIASNRSNVLFLPGIKGSMLYENNPLCVVQSDDCDARLWLPLTDATTPRLYLDSSGKSLHTMYAHEKGILASAFGTSFYDTFSTAMDARTSTTTQWLPVAYDWRLSLPDLVQNGWQRGSRIYFDEAASAPYLEQRLRALAATSPSGKVTIVAHSNGGLLAKELLQEVGKDTAARLVDKVILVAVPQGGAPRALASLLYGEGEAVPQSGRFAGLMLSAAHARTFALNAPMAYHLLPSAAFLAAHLSPNYPLVSFGAGQLLAPLRAVFGSHIDQWNAVMQFALDSAGMRTQTDTADLSKPAVLNPLLMTYANTVHTRLDAWQPPSGVHVYEIGGTGVQTISGIQLYEQPTREGGVTSSTISYRPLFRRDGDGTVPLASANMMNLGSSVTAYTIDLPAASDDEHWYSHATIFEVPEVEHLISRIIDGTESASARMADAAPAMATARAAAANATNDLAFYLHGAASLSVTNAEGKETSITADTMLQHIPGSLAGNIGTVSYVLVPAHGSYTITLSHSNDPYLTLDVERQENDRVVSSSTVASIALGTRGSAYLTIVDGVLASSTLSIDADGGGTHDAQVMLVEGTTVFAPEPSSPPPVVDAPAHHASSSTSLSLASSSSLVRKHIEEVTKSTIEVGYAAAQSVRTQFIQIPVALHRLSGTVHGVSSTSAESDIHTARSPATTASTTPPTTPTEKEPWWRRFLQHLWHFIVHTWKLLTAR